MSPVQKDPPSSPEPERTAPGDAPKALIPLQDEEDIDPAADFDLNLEEAELPASVRHGAAVIRRFWQHAPAGPGVYRMIGADNEVLYVGKAKSVRNRIASYIRPSGHTNRIARMIALTTSMVFISTETETEALLLETNYIKQMKPRFNVLMRDDKSFPYILLTGDHAAPQITKHRGARNQKGDYFGPFASVWAVNRTLNALQRAFLLRSCSDSFYANRTRPCLLFQIKRCSAPCTGEIDEASYAELAREARAFLSGKSRAVRDQLAAEMTEAAKMMEFERAARLRDRIAALSAIQGSQGVNPKTVEEADVFAIVEQAGQFCVEVFFFRTFQNWGNRAYFPRADKSLTPEEVLDSFLAQFYADIPPPRLILLSHAIENRGILEAGPMRAVWAQNRDRRASAGRKKGTGRAGPAECARGLGPETLRDRLSREASSRFGPALSAWPTCRDGSKSMTIRMSWAPMRSGRWSWRVRQGS